MDEDYAYRLSVRLFNKITHQSYDDISELRLLLEEAKEKCYPIGDTRRLLCHYEEALDKLDAGVYYVEVVRELSDHIFLSPLLTSSYHTSSYIEGDVAVKSCCQLL